MIYLFVAVFSVIKANVLFYDTKYKLEIQVDQINESREEDQKIKLTDLVKNQRSDIK